MCSWRTSSQLLAAVESNSAHAAFSTNRCCSISFSAILNWWKKKKKKPILVPWWCTINTEQDILLSFYLQAYKHHTDCVSWEHECLSKENCLLDQTCLSLSVFSALLWLFGQICLIQLKKKENVHLMKVQVSWKVTSQKKNINIRMNLRLTFRTVTNSSDGVHIQ